VTMSDEHPTSKGLQGDGPPAGSVHRGAFDEMYSSTPPWDIGRPQGAFRRLADSGELVGTVLDVGCGTGEHALMAAALGLSALGVDNAPRAIALAEQKAVERGIGARFAVWNALDLPGLGEEFQTVLDCGLFHVFDDDERVRFVQSLAAVVPAGGRFHMLCFSDHQPGDWGPRRLTQAEIRASFADDWEVESIDAAIIELTTHNAGAQAWLSRMTRNRG